MTAGDLSFPAGAMLPVTRRAVTYDPLGGSTPEIQSVGVIGPCSTVGTHGQYSNDDANGRGKWVGTVDIQAPPDRDIVKAGDFIELPSGELGVVTTTPDRPVNPFTGWAPYIRFTIANPGAEHHRVPGDNPLG